MNISLKKLDERAVIPTRGSAEAAGVDLYALDTVTVPAGETVIVHTGIAIAIPSGYAGLIYARSGMATKRALAPANKVGVIDADYRGEIMVALHNHGKKEEKVDSGERVAQLVVTPFLPVEFTECENLDETVRGTGGFGSTGV